MQNYLLDSLFINKAFIFDMDRVICYIPLMEKFKGYVPQSEGAKIVALREFLRRQKSDKDIAIVVFPSKGKPFAALIAGWKQTSQYGNPSVQLWAGGDQAVFAGGTAVCKIKDLDKFPKLKDNLASHPEEYRPKKYRYEK